MGVMSCLCGSMMVMKLGVLGCGTKSNVRMYSDVGVVLR